MKDGKVTIDAYYDDDTPATDAKVSLTDAGGKVVLEGRTNETGRWSFPAPAPGKYRVVVDGGAGHRTTVSLAIPAPVHPSAQPTSAVSPGSAAEEANSEAIAVSEGPTRSEFTGWTRTFWAVIGLLAIALGTWVSMRLLRAAQPKPAEEQ